MIKEVVMSAVIEKEGLSISYGVTDTAIAVLREKYSGVATIETSDDYELVRVGISEVRSLRVAVEKTKEMIRGTSCTA